MTTKEKIISGFLDIVSEEGYTSISIGNLSKLIGIAKSSFYSHFKSLDAIELAVQQHCLKILEDASFDIDFKSQSKDELLVNLINNFIEVFTNEKISSFLVLIDCKKQNDDTYLNLSKRIDMMIAARLTVALDFCVQRGWSNLNDTDSVSKILTPFVRTLLSDKNISDDDLSDSIRTISKLI